MQVEHEMALLYCGSKAADAYALAYAAMVFQDCLEENEATLEQRQILAKAIDCVFQAQMPDGSWPRSRPLFHYPKFGNAYCYEYEMLVQLLEQQSLREHCIKHLDKLGRATSLLGETAFPFGSVGLGWASGHHPQLNGPESWSTASVYHFLFLLDRLLAEVVRRKTFEYVGRQYRAPSLPRTRERDFAQGFLDSEIVLRGRKQSLRETLYRHFVKLISQNVRRIEEGQDLPTSVPISAIMFGPPGTSKTQLASLIAEFLGWPLLPVDPSLLVR
ncbi:MAG TPA: hypothetical protein VFA15_08805, partial [Nitrososphaera sp.]|nr:hypothetical protein [Nitrososphaera sp.]